MIFSFFSTQQHNAFAEKISSDFISKCPPEQINNIKNRKTNEKINKAINNIYTEARAFKKDAKLNIYTKAVIGNKFMWALKEAGYEEEFIDELTRKLLLVLGSK